MEERKKESEQGKRKEGREDVIFRKERREVGREERRKEGWKEGTQKRRKRKKEK